MLVSSEVSTRARAVALVLVGTMLLACSTGDGTGPRPFPPGEGDVVLPTVDEDWLVRFAFADTEPDDTAHTYLRGGSPITVYGDDGDLVFVMRMDGRDRTESEGWRAFDGWPGIAEGEDILVRREGDEFVFGWRRGATDDDVERAVAGEAPEGFDLVGALPAGWEEALRGPQFALDIGDGRGESHVSLRRSSPSELAAFRALLKDGDEAAEFITRASVDDPITTNPARRVRVDGHSAVVGPLDESTRVLVVEGDPGLTVLTSGNRLANFISDEGLVEIAEGARTATRDELRSWLDERLDEERAAQRAQIEELGDILLEVTRFERTHQVVKYEDGSLCISIADVGRRSDVSALCAPLTENGTVVGRVDDEIVGVVVEHSAVSLVLPDGTTVVPELDLMDPGGAAFFVDVGQTPGPVRVTVNTETFEV